MYPKFSFLVRFRGTPAGEYRAWYERSSVMVVREGSQPKAARPYTHEDFSRTFTKPTRKEDYTGDKERLSSRRACPADIKAMQMIEDFRRRQREGKDEPKWGAWCEFEVRLPNGEPVTVVYEPETFGGSADHFDFHGNLTETGYRSHFEMAERRGVPIEQYAAKFAAEVAAEYYAERLHGETNYHDQPSLLALLPEAVKL